MAKEPFEPFEQFAMPNEVRAFVEQSVTQARVAFDGIANAATQAVSHWQGQAHAARAGASEIAHKSMAYAEQNMAATLDFAQKLMYAKDASEADDSAVRSYHTDDKGENVWQIDIPTFEDEAEAA